MYPEIIEILGRENKRQNTTVELIASENYASDQVMEAQGSVLTNKYAEGLPRRRYYGGCEVVDEVEQLAIDRLCKLFGAAWANVQPHSGASANAAVMLAGKATGAIPPFRQHSVFRVGSSRFAAPLLIRSHGWLLAARTRSRCST